MAIYRFINGRLEVKPTSRAAGPVAGTSPVVRPAPAMAWQDRDDREDPLARKAS